MNPYREGKKEGYTATAIAICDNCKLQCRHDLDPYNLTDHSFLTSNGWIFRSFHPNIKAWYCSNNCAYNSKRAKLLERYWRLKARAERPLLEKIIEKIKRFWNG